MVLDYSVCLQEIESIPWRLEVSKVDQAVKYEQKVQLDELEACISITILHL